MIPPYGDKTCSVPSPYLLRTKSIHAPRNTVSRARGGREKGATIYKFNNLISKKGKDYGKD